MTELEKKYRLAKELLSLPRLQEFLEAGFIDELTIRNCLIVKDYVDMRATMTHLDALDELTHKYYISQERISSILYKKP